MSNYKTKISRQKAIQKLRNVVELAERWNNFGLKTFDIDRILLVGSLARNEEFVGDIDICVKTKRHEFDNLELLDAYLEWRLDVLGYAVPRSSYKLMDTFSCDPLRFIKNRDGRIEQLTWDQRNAISLTMQPQILIFDEGMPIFDDVEVALDMAKPISLSKAKNIIGNKDGPTYYSALGGFYLESYCRSLSVYPEHIRYIILDRDNSHQAYAKYLAIP